MKGSVKRPRGRARMCVNLCANKFSPSQITESTSNDDGTAYEQRALTKRSLWRKIDSWISVKTRWLDSDRLFFSSSSSSLLSMMSAAAQKQKHILVVCRQNSTLLPSLREKHKEKLGQKQLVCRLSRKQAQGDSHKCWAASWSVINEKLGLLETLEKPLRTEGWLLKLRLFSFFPFYLCSCESSHFIDFCHETTKNSRESEHNTYFFPFFPLSQLLEIGIDFFEMKRRISYAGLVVSIKFHFLPRSYFTSERQQTRRTSIQSTFPAIIFTRHRQASCHRSTAHVVLTFID